MQKTFRWICLQITMARALEVASGLAGLQILPQMQVIGLIWLIHERLHQLMVQTVTKVHLLHPSCLQWSECNLEVLEDCNLAKISRVTPGFVGADLSELVKKAGKIAKKRTNAITKCNNEVRNVDWSMQPLEAQEMEGLGISMTYFEDACKIVQPSLRREVFFTYSQYQVGRCRWS